METLSFGKLTTRTKKHVPGSVRQTGFSSPATHYLEPSIDLHDELILNRNATFFIRISGNGYAEFNICHNDVLIIDRSIRPTKNDLVLLIEEGAFRITPMPGEAQAQEYMLWGKITYIIHKPQ